MAPQAGDRPPWPPGDPRWGRLSDAQWRRILPPRRYRCVQCPLAPEYAVPVRASHTRALEMRSVIRPDEPARLDTARRAWPSGLPVAATTHTTRVAGTGACNTRALLPARSATGPCAAGRAVAASHCALLFVSCGALLCYLSHVPLCSAICLGCRSALLCSSATQSQTADCDSTAARVRDARAGLE